MLTVRVLIKFSKYTVHSLSVYVLYTVHTSTHIYLFVMFSALTTSTAELGLLGGLGAACEPASSQRHHNMHKCLDATGILTPSHIRGLVYPPDLAISSGLSHFQVH